jgi:hypothetical protein
MSPTPSELYSVAIHQPDFFPWMGFFDKLIRAKHFVILDHVQFPKKGGTYCNRVTIVNGGAAIWITAPVFRAYRGYRSIAQMQFSEGEYWRKRILRTLHQAYCKAPFFEETMQKLEPLINCPEENITNYNMNAIVEIAQWLGIPIDKIHRSSCLSHEGSSTRMLISLTQALGANEYVCGSGADAYQNDELFREAGIQLIKRVYQHPIYKQHNANVFVPGASIVDAFMNCGIENVRETLVDVPHKQKSF